MVWRQAKRNRQAQSEQNSEREDVVVLRLACCHIASRTSLQMAVFNTDRDSSD